jgi:hypothetical protein
MSQFGGATHQHSRLNEVIHPIHVDFHPGEIGKTIIFPRQIQRRKIKDALRIRLLRTPF